MFFAPRIGAVALVWIVGAYAIVFGGLMIYLAFQILARTTYPSSYDISGRPA